MPDKELGRIPMGGEMPKGETALVLPGKPQQPQFVQREEKSAEDLLAVERPKPYITEAGTTETPAPPAAPRETVGGELKEETPGGAAEVGKGLLKGVAKTAVKTMPEDTGELALLKSELTPIASNKAQELGMTVGEFATEMAASVAVAMAVPGAGAGALIARNALSMIPFLQSDLESGSLTGSGVGLAIGIAVDLALKGKAGKIKEALLKSKDKFGPDNQAVERLADALEKNANELAAKTKTEPPAPARNPDILPLTKEEEQAIAEGARINVTKAERAEFDKAAEYRMRGEQEKADEAYERMMSSVDARNAEPVQVPKKTEAPAPVKQPPAAPAGEYNPIKVADQEIASIDAQIGSAATDAERNTLELLKAEKARSKELMLSELFGQFGHPVVINTEAHKAAKRMLKDRGKLSIAIVDIEGLGSTNKALGSHGAANKAVNEVVGTTLVKNSTDNGYIVGMGRKADEMFVAAPVEPEELRAFIGSNRGKILDIRKQKGYDKIPHEKHPDQPGVLDITYGVSKVENPERFGTAVRAADEAEAAMKRLKYEGVDKPVTKSKLKGKKKEVKDELGIKRGEAGTTPDRDIGGGAKPPFEERPPAGGARPGGAGAGEDVAQGPTAQEAAGAGETVAGRAGVAGGVGDFTEGEAKEYHDFVKEIAHSFVNKVSIRSMRAQHAAEKARKPIPPAITHQEAIAEFGAVWRAARGGDEEAAKKIQALRSSVLVSKILDNPRFKELEAMDRAHAKARAVAPTKEAPPTPPKEEPPAIQGPAADVGLRKGGIVESGPKTTEQSLVEVIKRVMPKASGRINVIRSNKYLNRGGDGRVTEAAFGEGEYGALFVNKNGDAVVYINSAREGKDAANTLLHELIHYGDDLAINSDSRMSRGLRALYEQDEALKARIRKNYGRKDEATGELIEPDEMTMKKEWLAYRMEQFYEKTWANEAERTLVTRIKNYVKDMLMRMGIKEADAEWALREFARRVKKSEGPTTSKLSKTEMQELLKSDPFYSGVLKAVYGLKQEKGTGEQMLAMIARTPGAREVEIKWMGLDEFLKGKKSVTKQEIEDFVRQNQTKVKDVELSDGEAGAKIDEIERKMSDVSRNYYNEKRLIREELIYKIDNFDKRLEERSAALSYNNIVEMSNRIIIELKQGLRNATEISLIGLAATLKKTVNKLKDNSVDGWMDDIYNDFRKLLNNRLMHDEKIKELGDRRAVLEKKMPRYSQYVLPGGTNQREFFVTAPKGRGEWVDGHGLYEDIKNPIIRVRANDRTGPNGEKILFLEEVQKPIREEQEKMPEALRNNAIEIGLKRAIRTAAEEGYDAVAWITGKQQAERWRLSKVVKEVEWDERPGKEVIDWRKTETNDGDVNYYGIGDDTYDIHDQGDHSYIITDKTGESITDKNNITMRFKGAEEAKEYANKLYTQKFLHNINHGKLKVIMEGSGEYSLVYNKETGEMVGGSFGGRTLTDVVGKDIADKIMKNKQGKIEGLNLDIGGAWAYSLYDKQVPSIMNKIGKKFNAKVSNIDLGGRKKWVEPYTTKAEYDKRADEVLADAKQMLEENPPGEEYAIADSPGWEVNYVRNTGTWQVTANMKQGGRRLVHETEEGGPEDFARDVARGTGEQQVLAITPEMRKAVVEEGQPLLQRNIWEKPEIPKKNLPGVSRRKAREPEEVFPKRPTAEELAAKKERALKASRREAGEDVPPMQEHEIGKEVYVQHADRGRVAKIIDYNEDGTRYKVKFPDGNEAWVNNGDVGEYNKGVFDAVKKGPQPTPEQRKVAEAMYEKAAADKSIYDVPTKEKLKETNKAIDEWGANALVPLSTRLANLNESIKYIFRRNFSEVAQRSNKDRKFILSYFEEKAKMSKEDRRALELAEFNRDAGKITELLGKYGRGATRAYIRKEKLLDLIYRRLDAAGVKVSKMDLYHPRMIKDYDGLIAHMKKDKGIEWSRVEKAIQDRQIALTKKLTEENQPLRMLTNEEKAEVINQYIQGIPTGEQIRGVAKFAKQRKLGVVPPEYKRFYYSNDEALLRYIDSAADNIAMRKMFGKTFKQDVGGMIDVDASIGEWIRELMESGKIKPEQVDELRDLTAAYFKKNAMGGLLSVFRDINYGTTLVTPWATMTQIGDLAFPAMEYGVGQAVKALFKRNKIRVEDIGINKIADELNNASLTARGLKKGLHWAGFEKMDAIGSETIINAAFSKFKEMAKTDRAKLVKKLSPQFADDITASRVADDFEAGKLNADTKYVLMNEVLDLQPKARTEMPVYYLTHPDLRIAYQLKTYTIKQFDVIRNKIYKEFKSGDKKEAARKLLYLVTIMGSWGFARDAIVDYVHGRELNVPDTIIDQGLKIAGLSRYITKTLREKGVASAAMAMALPPYQFFDSATRDAAALVRGEYVDWNDMKILKNLPSGVGSFLFWRGPKGKELKQKIGTKTTWEDISYLKTIEGKAKTIAKRKGEEAADEYMEKHATELKLYQDIKRLKNEWAAKQKEYYEAQTAKEREAIKAEMKELEKEADTYIERLP